MGGGKIQDFFSRLFDRFHNSFHFTGRFGPQAISPGFVGQPLLAVPRIFTVAQTDRPEWLS
jgi:hypothetical protein